MPRPRSPGGRSDCTPPPARLQTPQERRTPVNVLLLLAIVCLLSSAVIAGLQKAWPLTLLSLGLALALLVQTGLIT